MDIINTNAIDITERKVIKNIIQQYFLSL